MSGFTREGVDVQEAENIVEWNLKQYPDSESTTQYVLASNITLLQGIFFLFGKGRLHVTRSRPDLAIEQYEAAKTKIVEQTGYEQLGSVMDWEMALCYLALGEWKKSADCWKELKDKAKWSKVRPPDHRIRTLLTTPPALSLRSSGKSIRYHRQPMRTDRLPA
jgi:tetratricopeptide (TPR) repeat protein